MTTRAIEKEFDILDATAQDSNGNGTSEHPKNQDQGIEYEIIIEPNELLMGPNGSPVESSDTHQNGANPLKTLDDTDDDEEDGDDGLKHDTTGTRPPS